MKLFTRLLLSALALLVAAELVPGIAIDTVFTAIIAAVVLGILNTLVKPVLVVLTLPITFLTLGFFIFIINALLFWFTAWIFADITVDGFLAALLGSLFVSLVSVIGNKVIK